MTDDPRGDLPQQDGRGSFFAFVLDFFWFNAEHFRIDEGGWPVRDAAAEMEDG